MKYSLLIVIIITFFLFLYIKYTILIKLSESNIYPNKHLIHLTKIILYRGELYMAYASINPWNNEVVQEYQNATDEEVQQAITEGHALYVSWRNDPVSSRSQHLHSLADYLEKHTDEFAEIMTKEMGKLFKEAQGEVALSVIIARYYADNAERILTPEKIESVMGDAKIISRPTGVILSVEPWNFPLYQIIRVFAPNFMAGNPVILKHADITPGSAAAFEKAVKESNMPKGSFKNLYATNKQVDDILADPRVTGLAFTGSERVGKIVGSEAGSHLKKSTLELGGSDPLLVLEDANLTELNKVLKQTRLYNSGQVCVSSKRLIVTENNYDDVLEMYISGFKEIKEVGDPMDPNTTFAPLSSVRSKNILVDQVKKAIDGGAKLTYGKLDEDLNTAHFMPVILTDMTPDNPMFYTEFFGPVGIVIKVKNEKEAIEMANNSNYGLSGIVFSGNADHGTEVASKIETGAVYVNSYGGTLPELPFGGVKNSGYGREMGDEGIKAFTNQELIVTRHEPIDLADTTGGFV